MNIDITKKYRTIGGQTIRIYATDCGGEYPVHGSLDCGNGKVWSTGTWTIDGKWWREEEREGQCDYDLIECSPWDDFKIDDKVLVRDDPNDSWGRRYFAGVRDGLPMTFQSGATSWSDDFNPVCWAECIRWTEEAQ